MVHISQLATRRVAKVSDVVKEGEIVKAKVLTVDMEKRRVSLSIADVERDMRAASAPAESTPAAGGAPATGAAAGAAAGKPGKPVRKSPLKGGLS